MLKGNWRRGGICGVLRITATSTLSFIRSSLQDLSPVTTPAGPVQSVPREEPAIVQASGSGLDEIGLGCTTTLARAIRMHIHAQGRGAYW
jgi:hypothetical protein